MLTKLSTFRGVSPEGEPLVQLFRQGDSIEKVAAGYQPEVQEWLSTYKSDRQKIALLVNAMGGSEYWGQNVNGDVFPWRALAHDNRGRLLTDYPYDDFYGKRIRPYGFRTFLEAHPFVHHRNKDPNRAFGQVVVSTLNEAMKRVELVVLIDRELAAIHDAQPFVDRIDAGEFPDVSMGCRVPYDVCTICGHKSKTKDDYCEHIKLLGMNRILDDGRRIGVINLHPAFFDISFVFIGADRTAKVMCKLASGVYVPPSVAEADRIYTIRDPDELGIIKAAGLELKEYRDASGNVLSKEELSKIYADRIRRAAEVATGRRGLMALGSEPSSVKRDSLGSVRGDLPEHQQKFRNEFSNPGTGYGDGALRTNAADGVDLMDDHNEKEAAFIALTGETGTRDDKEGVSHGYAQRDEGLSGDPREAAPSGLQKKADRRCNKAGSHYDSRAGGSCSVPPDGRGRGGGSGDEGGEKEAAQVANFKGGEGYGDAAAKGLLAGGLGGALGVGAMGLLGGKFKAPMQALKTMGRAAGEWGLAGGATNAAMHAMNKRAAAEPAKKLQAPPHRDQFPLQGQYKWNGMTVLVENAKGTWRRGKDWATHMKYDYGEIEGSLGADGDPVDVYVGPESSAPNVYIVHQNHVLGPKKGQYDEDKVMLGFRSSAAAKKAYLAHYDREDFFRSITEMPLAQFKKMIFRREADGEKIASVPEGKEKKAIDLKLEDLFDTPNTVRRERVWKDKSTGDSSYHVGSGLGKSFSSMQKTASAEEMDAKLAEVFKVSDLKVATDKLADILKEIDPDATTGRVVENLSDREECLPPDVLNEAGQGGLEKALTTPSMMGMVLKPQEFQRIILSAIGKSGLADELDSKGQTFAIRSGGPMSAPCGALGPDHFDQELMKKLMPSLGGRSYLGPVLQKRIIRITITPKAKPAPEGVDSPLLSKVGAAYNWYRNEMLKVATFAEEAVSQHPELHAGVYSAGASDLFSKSAAWEPGPLGMGRNTFGAVIATVPLALMYSAALRGDIEEGEDVGVLKRMIADHPNLTALGSGALVRELMKNKEVNRIVGNVVTEAVNAGRRIVTSGA